VQIKHVRQDEALTEVAMQEVRCLNCNRLIFKANMTRPYIIEYKCPKCKVTFTVSESQDFKLEPVKFEGFKTVKPLNASKESVK